MDANIVKFTHANGMIEHYTVDVDLMIKNLHDLSPMKLLAMEETDQINFLLKLLPEGLGGDNKAIFNLIKDRDEILNTLRVSNHESFVKYIKDLEMLPPEQRLQYYENEAAAINKALMISKITGTFALKSQDEYFNVYPGQNLHEKFQNTLTLFLSMIDELKIHTDESLPLEVLETAIAKIAWMHKIGVLDLVMQKCRSDKDLGMTYNISKAARIIELFTDLKYDSLKNCLAAIYSPSKLNEKNNPFKNGANTTKVEELFRKFKLK